MEFIKNTIEKYPFFKMEYFESDKESLIKPNMVENVIHFYTIIYFIKGEGLLTIDDNTYDVCNNSLFILAPGQLYFAHQVTSKKGYMIQFSEEFLLHQDDKLIHYLHYDIIHCSDYLKIIPSKEDASIEHYFGLMFNEYKSINEDLKVIIERQLLVCILCKIAELFSYKKSIINQREHISTQFSKLIDLHYKEWRHIGLYVDALNTTRTILNKEVYMKFKKRPIDLVNKKISDCARFLLIYTSKNIKEIAFELGFSDNSNFCKFFKKKVGISPEEYRRLFKL